MYKWVGLSGRPLRADDFPAASHPPPPPPPSLSRNPLWTHDFPAFSSFSFGENAKEKEISFADLLPLPLRVRAAAPFYFAFSVSSMAEVFDLAAGRLSRMRSWRGSGRPSWRPRRERGAFFFLPFFFLEFCVVVGKGGGDRRRRWARRGL